ncbi:MAG: type I secretion C-terminal target domain-containing protein, partial [Nitrobacter sp.]
ILDGTNGNDIIVAAANSTVQHTTIGFNAGGYDVGDKVSLIVDGTTYTYAVTAGHTSAEAVYDRLEDTHGHNLSGSNAGGLTWADNLSGNSVTLTGDLGETFAITSAITNSSGAGHTSQLAPSVTTTYDGLTLNGNGGDDYLIGSNGNDILFGGAGHDLLLGGDGDDKLHGDDGANVLSGGQGADTFFLATTATADTVLDYSFSEGDKIDLSALLDTNFGPASNPSDFVKLTQQGTDVHVQVDTNGPTGGANFVDVAILSHYGTSGAEIVNAVFAGQEHQLHVTT